MKPALLVGGVLALVAVGAAAYAYESAKPMALTLTPGTPGVAQTVNIPRKSGQQIVFQPPAGGSWVGIVSIPSGGSTTATLQTGGGNTPFTYTQNATDIAVIASWTLNGATYINYFKFT